MHNMVYEEGQSKSFCCEYLKDQCVAQKKSKCVRLDSAITGLKNAFSFSHALFFGGGGGGAKIF